MMSNILRLNTTMAAAIRPRKRYWRGLAVAATFVCAVVLSRCGGGSQPEPTGPRLSIVTATLPNGVSGVPYGQLISVSGGVAPYQWTVSTGTLPHNLMLTSNATSGATVSGTPDLSVQAAKFTVQVTDSVQESAQQQYTVTILLSADSLGLSADQMDFGTLPVGTASNSQNETLTNNSNSDLAIQRVAISGTNPTDYSQTTTCAGSVLAAGESCTVAVTFTPAKVGPSVASIEITDDTAGSPHSFALIGAGAKSGSEATLSATSLDFGNQITDTTSAALAISLSNYGTAALTVSSIFVSAPFSQTNNCPPSVPSGMECAIFVTFTPSATGISNSTLTVTDDASDSPQTVALSGNGVAGSCSPKGFPCHGLNPSCCAGLVCRQLGLRAFCEP